jgi:hypothetical protein
LSKLLFFIVFCLGFLPQKTWGVGLALQEAALRAEEVARVLARAAVRFLEAGHPSATLVHTAKQMNQEAPGASKAQQQQWVTWARGFAQDVSKAPPSQLSSLLHTVKDKGFLSLIGLGQEPVGRSSGSGSSGGSMTGGYGGAPTNGRFNPPGGPTINKAQAEALNAAIQAIQEDTHAPPGFITSDQLEAICQTHLGTQGPAVYAFGYEKTAGRRENTAVSALAVAIQNKVRNRTLKENGNDISYVDCAELVGLSLQHDANIDDAIGNLASQNLIIRRMVQKSKISAALFEGKTVVSPKVVFGDQQFRAAQAMINTGGWACEDVPGDGSCGYHALIHQMGLHRDQGKTVGHLRQQIQRDHHQNPGKWLNDEDLQSFVKRFPHYAVAVVHPALGHYFRQFFYWDGQKAVEVCFLNDGSHTFPPDTTAQQGNFQLPTGKQLLRLSTSGVHYVSVTKHPALTLGALRDAYN